MLTIKQYFMDGCFDGYHYGHVHAILQGKLLCDNLILGTHTNEEMIQHKNDPLFDYSERKFMLQNCKYIDEFVGNVDYIVACKTLDKFNCSKYVHGNEVLITRNGENGIDTNVINNRYITYETTEGISTTSLLLRLYNYKMGITIIYNNDIEYLKNIYSKTIQFNLKNYNHCKKIIYLDHSWDLLNSIHIKHIQKIKDKFPDYNLIGIINNKNDIYIYNQLERAIILSSIKLIDNVIMDYEYIQDNNLYIDLKNSIEFNKQNYIMNINFDKFKKKLKL
jgi:ethanolamine-phosphate cytidylyltransferase